LFVCIVENNHNFYAEKHHQNLTASKTLLFEEKCIEFIDNKAKHHRETLEI